MTALGYRFPDKSLVLRVLSYTNYHPGLIQYFCQTLLNKLQSRTNGTSPPFYVEPGAVEAVYRDTDVRRRIRERFDWTLALDTRYQAIAWAMVQDQMQIRDSYARAYSAGDIRYLALYWWSQAFEQIDDEGMRDLLDQMRGLGVLVVDNNGYYRLRSPNLVRLMGLEVDIEDRLLELSNKQPPVPFVADSHHALLPNSTSRYSPFTFAQERNLTIPQLGVGLVFASEALGLNVLSNAFDGLVPSDRRFGVHMSSQLSSINGRLFVGWLGDILATYVNVERIVVHHCFTNESPETIAEILEAVLQFCHSQRAVRTASVRVLFVFDHQATWSWHLLPTNQRENLETRVDVVMQPRRWDMIGIRQRLALQDKINTDRVCQQVLRATGGWPMLLDEVFDRCGAERAELHDFAQLIEAELAEPMSPLRLQFTSALGIEEHMIRGVLDFILREGSTGIERDFVTPDFLGDTLQVTMQECSAVIEYLRRLSCLDVRNNIIHVDPLVRLVLS